MGARSGNNIRRHFGAPWRTLYVIQINKNFLPHAECGNILPTQSDPHPKQFSFIILHTRIMGVGRNSTQVYNLGWGDGILVLDNEERHINRGKVRPQLLMSGLKTSKIEGQVE